MQVKMQGFTLIELVMVIVIVGILGVAALPKFVDLTSDADKAAVQGLAGALSAAANVNYAASKISGRTFAGISATSAACTSTATGGVLAALQAGSLLQDSTVIGASATGSVKYTITGGTPNACTAGAGTVLQCNLVSVKNASTVSAIAFVPCTI